jgi:hypothetical protein
VLQPSNIQFLLRVNFVVLNGWLKFDNSDKSWGCKVIKREVLLDKKNGLLDGDRLTIMHRSHSPLLMSPSAFAPSFDDSSLLEVARCDDSGYATVPSMMASLDIAQPAQPSPMIQLPLQVEKIFLILKIYKN